MSRRVDLWLWLVVALALAAFAWLMRDNRPGDAPPKPIAIAELRALAASLPGRAPTRIEAQLVGSRQTPYDMIAAGSGLRQAALATMAYRLELPGRGPIVIDSGMRPETAAAIGVETYYERSQQQIEAALRRASLVLLTSERGDHGGGLRAVLAEQRVPAALNAAQQRFEQPDGELGAPEIVGTAPQAVAPGVVVVPTHEITPGAQMVYVRLGSGREYLFTGDAAMLDVNWRELRGPARLARLLGPLPARDAVFAWLRTIRALKRQAPRMLVIPGHDINFLRNVDRGRPRLKFDFTPEPEVSGGATR